MICSNLVDQLSNQSHGHIVIAFIQRVVDLDMLYWSSL